MAERGRARLTSDPKVLLLTVLTGLGTGLIAVLFKTAIHLVSAVGLETMLSVRGWARVLLGLVVPAAGGLLVSLSLTYLNRADRSHGIPDVMEQVALREGYVSGKAAWLAPLNASLVLGTGNSAGPEGPVVHAGAGLGSFIGRYTGLSTPWVKALVIAGSASALAAMYNAPVAGTLFALEVIAGELDMGVLSLSLIASVVSSVISRSVFGSSPAFAVAEYHLVSIWELFPYALLGALCGAVAHLYNRAVHWSGVLFRTRVPVPAFWQPVLGGLLVGAVGLFLPQILGPGEDTIEAMLRGDAAYGAGLLALLAVVKILTTATTVGSGQPGGIFTPALFVGAATGGAFGWCVSALAPGLTGGQGAYALVGMGALLGGSLRAPVTAVILLFELTGDYRIILPLMLAAGVSYLMGTRISPDSIYTQVLTARGINLEAGRNANLLRAITVAEAMTAPVITVRPSDTLEQVIRLLQSTRHSGFPVVEGDRVVGVITLNDIRATPLQGRLQRRVSEVMSRRLVTADPTESLHAALLRLQEHGIGRLIVLDREGKLVGVLTRTDAIKAYYRRQIETEMLTESEV